MLSAETLERILASLGQKTIVVVGDLFLDRYFDIDPSLTEPSIETGLDAYQVTRVRSMPGAAGTVVNNLVALGVGRVVIVSVIGDDGEGYELGQAIQRMPSVDQANIHRDGRRRTPTYAKPLVHEPGRSPRELNRLDIKNRKKTPTDTESRLMTSVADVWPSADAILVLDQVSEEDCGVVTASVRERLASLAAKDPTKIVLADSRERIGLFRGVSVKPNDRECRVAVPEATSLEEAMKTFARRLERTVYCTCGPKGIWVQPAAAAPTLAPAPGVEGPIDTVGAGDSANAGLACALSCEASPFEAAAFANLIASVTIQQIGTTGTASAAQVREAFERSA